VSTTHWARAVVLALIPVVLLGCPRPKPALKYEEMSGFLEDYSLLRPGREGQAGWVYWDEDADWRSFTKVMFEPVTIWRAGGGSLDAIVEKDLMALAAELQNAVEARLVRDYEIVRQPGPGVMEIELAITQAQADDAELDVFTSEIDEKDLPADTETLAVATKAFLDTCVLEGEVIDTGSGSLLAAAVDIWVADRQARTTPASWREVRAAFRGLADRLAAALARRTAG
jgi:hypothetical protein